MGDELKLPEAILFDLDDTILAFTKSADPTWRGVCSTYAPRVPGVTADALYDAIDASRTWFWEDPGRHREGRLDLGGARRKIVTDALRRLEVQDLGLAHEIADRYSSERENTVEPFPGAIETLAALRERGVRLALLTNGNAEGQRRKIDRNNLAGYFECIIVEGEFGVGKPDERVYLHALAHLGTRPEETWMVGDNLVWDVEAPQRLGIYAIWVDFEAKGLPPGATVRPDRVVRSIEELMKGERPGKSDRG